MSLANELNAFRKSIKDDLAQYKAITDLNEDNIELLNDIATTNTRITTLEESIQGGSLPQLQQQITDLSNNISTIVQEQITPLQAEITSLRSILGEMLTFMSALRATYILKDGDTNQDAFDTDFWNNLQQQIGSGYVTISATEEQRYGDGEYPLYYA